MAQKERSKNLKIIQGRVVSDKLNKTRVILVESTFAHPLFKKMVRRSVKIKVHDERNEAKVGDLVQAIETRPLSAQKRHRLHKVMERSQ